MLQLVVGLTICAVINPGDGCNALVKFTVAPPDVLSIPLSMLLYVNAFKLVPSAVMEMGHVSGTPAMVTYTRASGDSIYVAVAI